MSDVTPVAATAATAELPSPPPALEAPLPLSPAAGDPFGKPLASVLPEVGEDGEELEELDDDERGLQPGQRQAEGAAPAGAAKGKTPGRGGAAGPKMRKNALGRLGKLTGAKVDPAEWAQALKEEARRSCEAAGVPFEDGAPEARGPGPESEHAQPEAAPGDGTTGHRFTPAAPEEVMGQPAADVAEMAQVTGILWGMLAKQAEGTRWDFSGEREMTILAGTPYEKRIVLNSAQKLTDLSAVLAVKHGAKLTGKATSPEMLFGGALLFAFGPQAAESLWNGIQKARAWWKSRKGGE